MDVFGELEFALGKVKKMSNRHREFTFGDIESIVAPFVLKRSALPILQTVNFCGNKAQATDLETFVVLEAEGLNVEACFDVRELKTLSRVPLSAKLVKLDRLTLEVENGNKQRISLFPREEFPFFGVSEEAVNEILLPIETWGVLVRTGNASNFKDKEGSYSRPIMSGVLLHNVDGQLRVVATDGFVLAVNSLDLLCKNFKERRTIIPASLLNKADGAVKKLKAEMVALTFYSNRLKIEATGDGMKISIVSNLIEGSFPDYAQIMPNRKGRKLEATINRLEFVKALKEIRTNELSRDWVEADPITRFVFSGDEVSIEALDKRRETKGIWRIEAKIAGDDALTVCFGVKHMLQVLSAMPNGEFITLSFGEKDSSGLIVVGNSQAVVMPMSFHEGS